MPKFLEKKLESEYGKGDPRVYATMNAIGAMHGNVETAKGAAMQKKHEEHMAEKHRQGKVSHNSPPNPPGSKSSSDGAGHWTGH